MSSIPGENDSVPNRARVVDSVSIGLPARRFSVKATIGYDTRVPLLPEFALRLLRIMSTAKVEVVRQYFGLSDREWDVLVDELLLGGLVLLETDSIRLSPKGIALFRDNSDEDPRIAIVETFEKNIAFETTTLTPLKKIPYDDKPSRVVQKLAKPQGQSRISVSSAVKDSFKKHFMEIARSYLPNKTNYDRAYVYSVDESIPKALFSHEIELPVILDNNSPALLSIDWSILENGRYGSRDELLRIIASAIAAPKNNARFNSQTLSWISRFDQGLLSNELDAKNPEQYRSEHFILSSNLSGDKVDDSSRFIGALTSDSIRPWIIDQINAKRFTSEYENAPVIWLKPKKAHWGRSSRFESFLGELRDKTSLTDNLALLAVADQDFTSSELKTLFQRAEPSQSWFDLGLIAQEELFPPNLEIVYRPGFWCVFIVHLYPEENEQSIPFGLFTERQTILEGWSKLLKETLVKAEIRVAWNTSSQPDILRFMKTELR